MLKNMIAVGKRLSKIQFLQSPWRDKIKAT